MKNLFTQLFIYVFTFICAFSGDSQQVCTLTHGAWGNDGGHYAWLDENGNDTVAHTLDIITTLIMDASYGDGQLVIGDVLGNSLTITNPNCLLVLLPGNGKPSTLPGPGSITNGNDSEGDALADMNDCTPYKKKYHHFTGRMRNTLAANTLALQLNFWYNTALNGTNLGDIVLADICIFVDPLTIGTTVQDLLDYTNRFLSGQLGNPKGMAGAINQAVWAVNEYFHQCIILNPCLPLLDVARTSENLLFQSDNMEILNLAESENLGISLFPNPASNKINLELHSFDGENVEIQMIDMLGRVVMAEKKGYHKNVPIELQIPAGIQNGIYFIRVTNVRPIIAAPILISDRY